MQPSRCFKGETDTMPANFIPANDTEFADWLENFHAVAEENKATLTLADADLTQSSAVKDALRSAITRFTATQAEARSATQSKMTARKEAENLARAFARRVQANPHVSNALKESLGVPVREPSTSPILPMTPANLVVRGQDNGINILKWDAGGNKPGAQYIIEGKCGEETAWSFVDVCTRTTYKHAGCKPGVRALYRIKAKRGANVSGYSNEAFIYGGA